MAATILAIEQSKYKNVACVYRAGTQPRRPSASRLPRQRG
jgi:hypothetical protein